MITAARTRTLGRLSLPRPGRRTVATLVFVAVLLTVGWFWLRESSLVAVRQVAVEGNRGPDAAHIQRALHSAARSMTTLDVRLDQLQAAVAPYAVVKGLEVSTNLPHGMRIRVLEQIPVGAVSAGGRPIAVSADGTLLHDVSVNSLPMVPLRAAPGGGRVSDPGALSAIAVLAAAPAAMRSRISQVTAGGGGATVQLRAGPNILFGGEGRLSAKWAAATAVLGDPGSVGASYVDVSDPGRPAAGASRSHGGP